MNDLLLQLEKEHQQQLENLKKQHTQLAEQVKSAQAQMTAVEGAFAAKQQSLEQIQNMIKACNAQSAQTESGEVSPPPPPAVEGEAVLPDYKKPVNKPKKNTSRPAVMSEAVLPH